MPAHEATTAHLGSAYPFMVANALPGRGVYVGRDLMGGSFSFDPFELYGLGALTNPNIVVLGQIGRGKSSFVKTYLWRQAAFGRQAWVVDPKGEYGPLARAWGGAPICLQPGGRIRLNPLDHPGDPNTGSADVTRRRVELLCALGAASLGRSLTPSESAAGELALRAVGRECSRVPTIVDVMRSLLNPTRADASEIGTDVATLKEMGRDFGLELRRLVEGDLQGMFDGPTTTGIDLSSPLVVLDLSAVYASPAIGVLMTCATAWLSASLSRAVGTQRFVVIDEAWAILRNLGVARWLQSSWKLSRALGVSNVAVLHRLSDLVAVGPEGSEQMSLARGLISDSETRIVYSQPAGEIETCTDILGLTSTEADLLPNLRRGVALWNIGSRSYLVEHRLSSIERAIVDTDSRMAAGTPRDA